MLSLLAKKAADLISEPDRLPGWLHRAATLEAANLSRSEQRYQLRNHNAMMDNQLDSTNPDDEAWQEVLPHLDAALLRLPSRDRQIVVMHFLEGKPHDEIAKVLGKTASAVQRQCHRCLAKLARLLRHRGVPVSVAVLAGGMATEGAKAAPAALLAKVPAAALLVPGNSSLPLLSKTFLLMTSTKKNIITAAAVATIAAVPIVQQQKNINNLQTRLAGFVDTGDQPQPAAPVTSPAPLAGMPAEGRVVSPRPAKRRPIPNLERELENAKERLVEAESRIEEYDRGFAEGVSSSTVRAQIGADETLVTGGFIDGDGNHRFTFVTPIKEVSDTGEELIKVASSSISVPSELIVEHGLDSLATQVRNTQQHAETWGTEEFRSVLDRLSEAGIDVVDRPVIFTRPGSRFSIETGTEEGVVNRTLASVAYDEDSSGFNVDTRIEQIDQTPQ